MPARLASDQHRVRESRNTNQKKQANFALLPYFKMGNHPSLGESFRSSRSACTKRKPEIMQPNRKGPSAQTAWIQISRTSQSVVFGTQRPKTQHNWVTWTLQTTASRKSFFSSLQRHVPWPPMRCGSRARGLETLRGSSMLQGFEVLKWGD